MRVEQTGIFLETDDMQKPWITINDCSFEFSPGQTILEVARENHIQIPTLCFLKGALPTGACRICVVEVQGRSGLVPACRKNRGS